jgi:predicted transglutaminase-like cysteine proteinase
MNIPELENYWNDKRPKNPVIYTGRAIPKKCPTCKGNTLQDKLRIDVRTMISPDDYQLKKLVEVEKLIGDTHDETMWNIQRWAVQNIIYIGDDLSQGVVEYWQFPFETLTLRAGDCEDGSLLMLGMAINAGIPPFRIRLVAGKVQPEPTAPEGGHAYLSYLREFDNQWVIIDWCYLEDSLVAIPEKLLHNQNTAYKNVWFSFNNIFSWADKIYEFKSF